MCRPNTPCGPRITMTNTHRHSCAGRSGYGTPLLVKGNYFGQIDTVAAL